MQIVRLMHNVLESPEELAIVPAPLVTEAISLMEVARILMNVLMV